MDLVYPVWIGVKVIDLAAMVAGDAAALLVAVEGNIHDLTPGELEG
jgi:hypothetical protein